jgi:DNA helicase MCM9
MNDFQEIRVQDQMNALGAGVVPKSIAVVLFGDLPGRIQPGDPVTLEGVVHQRWKPLWPGKRPEIELFIEATHIERIGSDSSEQTPPDKGKPMRDEEFTRFWALNRADEWRARAEILRATAPWLKGLPVPMWLGYNSNNSMTRTWTSD